MATARRRGEKVWWGGDSLTGPERSSSSSYSSSVPTPHWLEKRSTSLSPRSHTLIKRCTTAACLHTRCRWPGVGAKTRDAVNASEHKLVCMCCVHLSVVPFADDREDAEPTNEQQHQESGQGMQLHREAAGRLGVHLHDPGQWRPTFPVSQITLLRRTCFWHVTGWRSGKVTFPPLARHIQCNACRRHSD